MRMAACYFFLLMLLAWPASAHAADEQARPIVLGDSTVALNGPWKFRTGDDSHWADPAFDDSAWESVDLTPLPGVNDGDVGLSGYVPGWSTKGHPGYEGYAWYRIHLAVTSPTAQILALLGPWAVDSVYQIYGNGTLLGGVGDFSGPTPVAHGNHYPRLFKLPAETVSEGRIVIAIRVWMGPWGTGPGAGGIHIAPAIGQREAITDQYHLQWLKIFEGYAVDVIPALLFFLLAVLVLCLWRIDRSNSAYPWLAAALVLSGIQRGNQAFFFWLEIETVQDFVILIIALTTSLSLGAWMIAWRAWFKVETPAWLPKVVAALTLILMVAQLLARPWLYNAMFPHSVSIALHYLITYTRLAFLVVLVLIVYQGLRHGGREGWYALPAMLAIGVVLFPSELAALHVPGIWFPWGVGVSLSECASVVFAVLLFILLIRRLWSYQWMIPGTHPSATAN